MTLGQDPTGRDGNLPTTAFAGAGTWETYSWETCTQCATQLPLTPQQLSMPGGHVEVGSRWRCGACRRPWEVRYSVYVGYYLHPLDRDGEHAAEPEVVTVAMMDALLDKAIERAGRKEQTRRARN